MAEPEEAHTTYCEGHGGLPQMCQDAFVPQLTWLALSFLLLYVLMARIILPRIGAVLEERRDKIADDLDRAGALKRDADDALKAYEDALAAARGRAQAIAKETADKLRAESDRLKSEVDARHAKEAEAAEARIQGLKAAALANLNAVAVEVTGVVVSKLLGETPDAGVVASAVEAERAGR
jgi:F-type H+-transporting ATPase subunit b